MSSPRSSAVRDPFISIWLAVAFWICPPSPPCTYFLNYDFFPVKFLLKSAGQLQQWFSLILLVRRQWHNYISFFLNCRYSYLKIHVSRVKFLNHPPSRPEIFQETNTIAALAGLVARSYARRIVYAICATRVLFPANYWSAVVHISTSQLRTRFQMI